MADDDDRDDTTTTTQAPAVVRVPEEELPTKVTAISADEIARIEAEYEKSRAAASAKGPVTTAAPSTERDAEKEAAPGAKDDDDDDDSIVTMQVRPEAPGEEEEDPSDDSIVTMQKAPRDALAITAPMPVPIAVPVPPPAPVLPPIAPPKPSPPKPISSKPAAPATTASPSTEKSAPPARGSDSDIYDAEDDRTERRDIPFDEIDRAIARAKAPPPSSSPIAPDGRNLSISEISISEISVPLPSDPQDDSPTARRRAPGPYSRVPGTLPVPTIKKEAETDENPEADTTTDLSANAKRLVAEARAGEHVRRPPFGSESDVIDTEPRRKREDVQIIAANETDPALDTTEHSPGPPVTLAGVSRPPATTPLRSKEVINKTIRLGGPGAPNGPLAGAPAVKQQQASEPSIDWPNADRAGSGPPESGPRLQAVIPMKPASGGKVPAASATPSPGTTQNLANTALSPATLASPGTSSSANATLASASAPNIPPIGVGVNVSGMPSGSMQSASVPSGNMLAAGVPSGSMSAAPPIHGSSMPPSTFGQPISYGGGQMHSTSPGVPRATQSEPRWIVLVLVVLAVCIGIPTALYFALRPSQEDVHTEPPHKASTTIETSKPIDVGKRTGH